MGRVYHGKEFYFKRVVLGLKPFKGIHWEHFGIRQFGKYPIHEVGGIGSKQFFGIRTC
jgi:hypothetical protein